MKNPISTTMAVVLTLATFILPLAAYAGQADTFSYKGDTVGAMANFSNIDEAGIQTDVSVFSSDNKRHVAPGPVDTSSVVELDIMRFDSTCPPWVQGCPGYIMNAHTIYAPLLDKAFQAPAIAAGSWAELNATVSAFDQVSNSSFDVFVDLTWTCIGDVSRVNEPRHTFVLPGTRVDIVSGHSTYCSAQASGSVSVGQTNFTPGSSLDATIFSGTGVEVEVSITH